MNRKELLKRTWIPIKKRLPPDITNYIVCWSYGQGEPITMPGYVARAMAELVLSGETEMMTKDRMISHWQPRVEPEKRSSKKTEQITRVRRE